MFRSSLLCSALAVLLAGCTSSEIKTVKESHLADYPTYLVGQAFDNRHACASVDWKSFKDERERTVVEYTCQYKFAQEFYTKLVSELVGQSSVSFESEKARVEQMINESKEMAVKLQGELDALKAAPARPSWSSFFEAQTADLERLQSMTSFRNYLSANAQWKASHDSGLRVTAENCAAKEADTCKPFDYMLALTIRQVQNSIEPQRRVFYDDKAESENQARASKLQEYASGIESRNAALKEAEASKDGLISKAQSERDEEVKKYEDRLANFQSASEKVQWVVIDGQPQLAGVFLVMKTKDGEIQRPSLPSIVLGEIYGNSVEMTNLQKHLLRELWNKQK